MGSKKEAGGSYTLHIVYSEAFKRAVVAEVLRGTLNKEQARRKYGIGGKTTVLEWIRKYGTNPHRDVMMVRLPKERMSEAQRQRLNKLEEENKRLRVEAENERLRSALYEAMIELAEKQHGIVILKNSGAKR